jgi:OOP family OmpA-OmpF porin
MNLRVICALLFLTCSIAAAQMKDYPGYKDPALFTRMPHYFLTSEGSVVETPFDAYEFTAKGGTQRVEGRHLHYTYDFDESVGNSAGFLQIVRNYEAAARKIGGEILSDDIRRTTIRVAGRGQETWIALEAFNEGRQYELNIIEKQLMKQEVTASAEALRNGLKENGHVEVPGIFFDFGKADLKPESEPALKELATLLQANAGMKVWVVGHTDNVGSVESNLTLSSSRAASVIKAAVQRGIAASRLAPFGAGPYAPVASSATEEGRARNRRVELVSQP